MTLKIQIEFLRETSQDFTIEKSSKISEIKGKALYIGKLGLPADVIQFS